MAAPYDRAQSTDAIEYTVSIRLAGRTFAPTVFSTALVMLAILLFARLGFWQLSRAADKHALEADYAAGQRSRLTLTPANADTLPRYQLVEARGRYDPQHQILLDNMPSGMGQPGYRVVTPFALEQGGWLLVDRGWRPLGRTRADLPNIEVTEQLRTVSGLLDRLPQPGVRLGSAAAGAHDEWPRVMSFPQHADVEQALGQPLHQGLLLLDADQPDGYERLWQVRFDFGPQRHLGYAVQWFAFAVAAAVIYVITGLRRGRMGKQ